MTINWDDPAERAQLIERVGPDKYNEMQRQHWKDTTIAVVNGHAIRPVNTRWGRLFMVDGTDRAHSTLEGAKQIAREAPLGSDR